MDILVHPAQFIINYIHPSRRNLTSMFEAASLDYLRSK